MATVFVVHVRLSWGEERDYLVANDVEPGLAHRLATRKHWQEVMNGALINVPVGPYLPSNQIQPPIATAKVISVKAIPVEKLQEKLQRTRSQFIMADIWQRQSEEANYNFLHHDYDQSSQAQIKADIDYWTTGKVNSQIIKQTLARITDQRQRLKKELKNS